MGALGWFCGSRCVNTKEVSSGEKFSFRCNHLFHNAALVNKAHKSFAWLEQRYKLVVAPEYGLDNVRSGSTLSMASVAPAKSGARPPVAMTCIGAPNSLLMRATRPSTNPT